METVALSTRNKFELLPFLEGQRVNSRHLHYFAYGSNLTASRLIARVGPCEDLGVATLPDFELAFRKDSHDGSAKCDLVHNPGRCIKAEGVVYRMPLAAKSVLDRFEGVGVGYRVETIEAKLALAVEEKQTLSCFVYLAEPPWVDQRKLPYSWYRDFVLSGGIDHGLSDSWRGFVESHPVQLDTDVERHSKNQKILEADIAQAMELFEVNGAT